MPGRAWHGTRSVNALEIRPEAAPRPGEPIYAQTWPSRLDRKDEILAAMTKELLSRGWVLPTDEPWLQLCLDEVVVNAILHGNEGDPNLTFSMELFHVGNAWVLHVSDQGEGFTADRVPDQDNPESLLLEHGRGIRIMGEWLDRLVYFRSGATAVLERRIEGSREPKGEVR